MSISETLLPELDHEMALFRLLFSDRHALQHAPRRVSRQ